MITHLILLDKPSAKLNREDRLQLIRWDLSKNIQEAYEPNQQQCKLRSKVQTFKVSQETFRRNFAQSSA